MRHLSESILSRHQATHSLRDIFGGIEESALNLPRVMDGMIESALSSFDRAAGGLLAGLSDTKIEFGNSDDGSHLVVRLHMPDPEKTQSDSPSVKRRVHAAVLGLSHLRIKIEAHADGFTSSSTQTIALPAKVSADDIDISSKADGTVHISLRILTKEEADKETFDQQQVQDDSPSLITFPIAGRFFPALFARDDDAGPPADLVQEIPSSDGIENCKGQHHNERLLISKCLCDALEGTDSRAVCYGNLISKSVSMARRLGRDDFATSVKHHAIECANGVENKVECLNGVAKHITEYLYTQRGSKDREDDLTDRIRQAIESEDDGPSNFQSSTGTLIGKLVFLSLILFVLFWMIVLLTSRRQLFGSGGVSPFSRLSSVLTQSAKSPERSASRTAKSLGNAGSVVPVSKVDRSSKQE
eukprot:GFKZ01015973.1.p1 GENE.GFKZ01015973.1~~GFKZ01015973.1.p1  ORF type:complete len:415 (-),score=59.18 GFKZ01015973.1:911-2155(-)